MFSHLKQKYNILKHDYYPRWQRYRFLREFLPRNGVFVEAGANDGVTQSNTIGLEQWAGWRGLLIEPVPALAARCRQARSHCAVENCALVPADYGSETIELWDVNLMSLVKGFRSEEDELRCLKNGENYQGITRRLITVPARPLSQVLDSHGLSHIDFVSLDMEGYEPQALQGLDFTRHRPNFFLIETGQREEIKDQLGPSYLPLADTGQDILYGLKKE